ncbi:MAG: heavy metal translocating P-type ATPase [Bacteroidetes bacterium]|uniref:P-type Cu(2+) transporter n=1 Tax=Candidatus Cryptobacteroides gallistercoris TaxID=2840765 RepID=A0A940DPA4_9BACT|nr:heavy metal translocating P-type ATPase [Candidatus Cryptobacteroides gallistercoris]
MEGNRTKDTFPILGMSCAACAARVEKTLNAQKGVIKATVNYAAATANVEYECDECSPGSLRKAVQDAGYDLLTDKSEDIGDEAQKAHDRRYAQLRHRTVWAIALALPTAVIGMFFMDVPYMKIIMWLLATPVVFWLGRGFFASAWKQLRHRTANMDTLVASSTGIAYLFSVFNLLFPDFWLSRGIEPHVYFEASSVIIAFILLGRLLEEKAKGNASDAIRKLMGLQPKTVTVVIPGAGQTDNMETGASREIPISAVRPGDIISVRPGERVAVDGNVISGSSYVDESMLSGEPVPVAKQPGAKVFAGTINQKGSFMFRADKVGTDTLLSKIIAMVQDAQGSKAPVQKLVDRIAAVFVPVIMGIALLSFILWVILDGENGITHGLLAMVTVLIIACPCALGLATPTAIMVGIGKGADNGILIKDAESIETARKIDSVVLDKTGTVTEGRPSVTDIVWSRNAEKDAADLGKILSALEALSEHPLAEAVVKHLGRSPETVIRDFESITGAGVKGSHEGRRYFAGNRKLLADNGIEIAPDLDAKAMEFTAAAKTVIWFSSAEESLAIAAISDRIKESSIRAIRELHDDGIEVYMLTGDNQATAAAVAEAAGIKHFKAEVLPQDKAGFIKELQRQGRIVAMAGDGINDSAALATADLSIAMGGGSDIAMDVAKMTIISSDLTKIPEAFRLSKLTVRTIRQNLFWAFIYNMIGVPVAAGALYPLNGFLLNPMIAGAAMAFSSVSVVTNSLRLKGKRTGVESESHIESDNHIESHNHIEHIEKETVMKKEFKVSGMMCNHCRMHVEKALNRLDGVKATVTLEPPVASVEFTSDKVYTLAELQKQVTDEAGDYTLEE